MRAELAAITCYFNPQRYRARRENYEKFVAGLNGAGLHLAVAELAVGGAPFALPDAPNIVRCRCNDAIWQKERLLRLALDRLPSCFTKVVWIDCDVLFEGPSWVERTCRALDEFPVIQPFSQVVLLPRGQTTYAGEGEEMESFAALSGSDASRVTAGNFAAHGHPGFAWAARRDLLQEIGFYDTCLTGVADHLMAHGFCGDWQSSCINDVIDLGSAYHAHFVKWAERAYASVGGRIGCIPGRLLHLWHGNDADRLYDLRNEQFKRFAFDPESDIRLGEGGVWEWASAKPAMHQWARDFFVSRNEDELVPNDRLVAVRERLASQI
jgi:hypothetical protein